MMPSGEKIDPAVKNLCLVNAAISGQTGMLDFWLDQGADPKAKIHVSLDESNDSYRWQEQQGLLFNAAASGNAELLAKVLSLGLDVNQKNTVVPLLNWTIANVNDEKKAAAVVELLLKAGADPNARDGMEETALFKCAYKTELVQPLLRAGADINARDRDGSTALIRYATSEPFVRELLAHGADPSVVNKRGETALSVANEFGRPACARLIQEALDRQNGLTTKTN
jgi:ankyrin repeat protein